MARKSGFVRRPSGMVRDTAWFGSAFTATTAAAASTAVLVTSLSAAALALRPFTVIRTRGVLGIRSDQTSTTENFSAVYGGCVVSDQASAIGVTAVPTPFTDHDSDLWYWIETLFGTLVVTTDISRYIDGSRLDRTFDSKAARKVDIGQDVITVVEITDLSSGAIITHHDRTLVKLH